MSPSPSSRMRNQRRGRTAVFLATFFFGGVALAGTLFTYSASHVTKKTPQQVVDVLTAYSDICDKGCKYEGPDVKEFVQLAYEKTPTRWFTHTYISTSIRDVRYFSVVTKQTNDDGSVLMTTRQLDESDKALIAKLESATHRKHDPAFDSGKTTFTIQPIKDGTKLTQSMKMSASGMLAMFGGKIEEGMKNGARVTFKNVEK